MDKFDVMTLMAPDLNPKLREQFAAILRQVAIDEREACAKIIEDGQETTSNNADGTTYYLSPRRKGNLAGLAYADAIRARNDLV